VNLPDAVEVTQLLRAWSTGDSSALERLAPIVHSELYRLARQHLARERQGHILQTSALINEVYVRLMGTAPVEWEGRSQFFAVSARMMRQILVDFARRQLARKRGGRPVHVHADAAWNLADDRPLDFVDLDRALNRLAELDSRQSQIVELRFFGGLENTEIASFLQVSEATVTRDWRLARAFLHDALGGGNDA